MKGKKKVFILIAAGFMIGIIFSKIFFGNAEKIESESLENGKTSQIALNYPKKYSNIEAKMRTGVLKLSNTSNLYTQKNRNQKEKNKDDRNKESKIMDASRGSATPFEITAQRAATINGDENIQDTSVKGSVIPRTTTKNKDENIQNTSRKEEKKLYEQGTHLFLSFTCPYCWQLWDAINTKPDLKNHVLTQCQIWFLPRTEKEAGVCFIFYYLREMANVEKASEFIDWYGKNRESLNSKNLGEVFININNWLQENKLPTLIEMKNDKETMNKISNVMQTGVDLSVKFNIDGYPTVINNGKDDPTYFKRFIEKAKKE